MNNQTNTPMSEYLLKIQLLVTNTEFKNKEIADQYETVESRLKGEAYIRAKEGTDIYESYTWDDAELASLLNELHFTIDQIQRMVDNPSCIPPSTMQLLLEYKRKKFIENYKETNKYYINLMGIPFDGDEKTGPDPLISIPYEFYKLYQNAAAFGPDTLIHELPPQYLELFLSSSWYRVILKQYPDVEYLKHLGSYAIPIEKSRKAHDGDILLINTSKLHTYHYKFGDVKVSSDMVHLFTNVYEKVHRYVYNTLRGNFEMIYTNYNSFIRFLAIYMTIGNCLNECMKRSSSLIYMNNATMNDYFMMYGLPSVIMDNSESMVEFLKKFRLLLMDKGTNTVYRVKDIIGYEYTDIYTLIMVKQQAFKDGKPMYYLDEDGTHKPMQDIVFRRFGTAEDNTSYFKYRDSDKTYTLEEITSGDPRWWNTKEVEEMIQTMNYTLSNSKYIQLSTSMSMDDIWWQSTILLRGLLDNRFETQVLEFNIDYNVGGLQQMSLFEAILILIITMNWKHTDFNGNHFKGGTYYPTQDTLSHKYECFDRLFIGHGRDIYSTIQGKPFKVSSFNFDVVTTNQEWYASLPFQTYLDPDTLIPMIESVLKRENTNLGDALMSDVKNIYKYLIDKLVQASTIHEFRQVEEAYKNLFLVDPYRLRWYDIYTNTTTSFLLDEYDMDNLEYDSFIWYLSDDPNTIDFEWNNVNYNVSPYEVMANDVKTLTNLAFDKDGFFEAFCKAVNGWSDPYIETGINVSSTIKANYQSIIVSKVTLDVTASSKDDYPTTFEALLLRTNPTLYRGLMSMQSNMDAIVLLIKSIIRSLESYTNTKLIALQMQSLGASEYIRILKEVITYFKSYMVEFTKDEFTYIFGGPFDYGGNSDMLHLYDEIHRIHLHMMPRDVIRLHDVSHANVRIGLKEPFNHFVYDEALFRIRTTYLELKYMGYDVWFDSGQSITKTPFKDLSNDDVVVGNLVYSKEKNDYIIILPKNNIADDNYYGNTRPNL